MIFPLGTVIFQIQSLFAGKLFGKLGLQKNPLEPLRKSPDELHAAEEMIIYCEFVMLEGAGSS